MSDQTTAAAYRAEADGYQRDIDRYIVVKVGLERDLSDTRETIKDTQDDLRQTTNPAKRAALERIIADFQRQEKVQENALNQTNDIIGQLEVLRTGADNNALQAQLAPRGPIADPTTHTNPLPVQDDPLPGATGATTFPVSPQAATVSAPLVTPSDPNNFTVTTSDQLYAGPVVIAEGTDAGITTTVRLIPPIANPPDIDESLIAPDDGPPVEQQTVQQPYQAAITGTPTAAPAQPPSPQPLTQPPAADPADDGTTDSIQATIDRLTPNRGPNEGIGSTNNVSAGTNDARKSGNLPEITPTLGDWRFRITLAKDAKYLYNAPEPGILKPLQGKGVIFPYVPQITVPYSASYEATDITHSNYKIYNYRGSSVDQITIAADFTAQDTYEANYLLAVMHFFRSVTKMFYGQDKEPRAGIPPPLCFLHGFGVYQFDNHPVVIQNFTYTFPNDVDYIAAGDVSSGESYLYGGSNAGVQQGKIPQNNSILSRLRTLTGTGLAPGGVRPKPQFTGPNFNLLNGGRGGVTMVPTKVNIQLSCLPIVTRRALSNKFSLKDYANGSLLKGSKNTPFGGLW